MSDLNDNPKFIFKCVCGFVFFSEDKSNIFKQTKVEGNLEEGIVECPECGLSIIVKKEITE